MRVGGQKRKKNSIITSLIIGGAVIIGVAAFLIYMNANFKIDTEVVITDTALEVKGMYSGAYEFSSISSVELKDTLPEILERNNGTAINEVKKGNFKLEGLGLCRLYLISEEGPYLYIKVNDFYVIINYTDRARTEELYTQITAKLN